MSIFVFCYRFYLSLLSFYLRTFSVIQSKLRKELVIAIVKFFKNIRGIIVPVRASISSQRG